jgi:hypothetical protein
MAGKEKNRESMNQAPPLSEPPETESIVEEDQESSVVASARDIPQPATTLPIFTSKSVGEMLVSYLGELSSAPNLDQVERLNKSGDGKPRTPLTTVILAIVAAAGGEISVQDLAAQVGRYWNRLLPGSPYTLEEFVFMVARNSDNLRVS